MLLLGSEAIQEAFFPLQNWSNGFELVENPKSI